jgi:hypothetical protein
MVTQKDITAIGLSVESVNEKIDTLNKTYPAGYDSMPANMQAEADNLATSRDILNSEFVAKKSEFDAANRSSVSGSVNSNRLSTPGESFERGRRIHGGDDTDQYGFSRYQRERKGKLLNFRDNEGGRRLAELTGAIALACCPTLSDGSELKELGLSVLREKHGISNANNMREMAGVQQRDLTSAVEAYGGVLAPTVLEASILILQENYGVLEQYANVIPLPAGVVKWPKRFQGPAAVHTLEGLQSNFDNQMKFNSYSLTAIDSYCFVSYPNQLSQDSIIPLGDYVAGQIAWAQSYRWNDDLVNGDGSPKYGGTKGLTNQFDATLQGGGANPGLYVAPTGSGSSNWSTVAAAIGVAQFEAMKGQMRMYQLDSSKWKWYTTWQFYCNVMQPLQVNANYGFNATFEDGKVTTQMNSQMFMGHEVVIIPQPLLPGAGANNYLCFFGQMDMAVTMGIRMGLDILSSQVAGLSFLTNSTYVRGIQRACVVPHSVGLDTLDPNGNHIAGPLVAMKAFGS